MRISASLRKLCAICVSVILLAHSVALACGPETIDPIFTFTRSPDLPFTEFTKGKIGILQSTFGRKTLVIAHRYLGGGTFTEPEQEALVEALKGKSPEQNDDTPIKAWLVARKLVLPDEKNTPSIYDERRHAGYDFFPNCTSNAFEVATETLKNRVTSYGADDANVRNWLEAQDVVFKNCAEGAEAPQTAPTGSPRWLQKDRDYQVAAAFFYSTNFNEARTRFQQIAEDPESDWQDVASYLVCRTLVRQASLTSNAQEKNALYEQAEVQLINQSARGGKFQNAARRLLGLVRFRVHPQERVRELAQTLDEQSGNENLRQDLIDYTWLLDKFDQQLQTEEEERKRQASGTPTPEPYKPNEEYQKRHDALQRGELIDLYFTPRNAQGKLEYEKGMSFEEKSDVTEAELIQDVEIKLGRKLLPEEMKDLKGAHSIGLSRRQWLLSPNRKFDDGRDYEGCDDHCNDLELSMFPSFLRADELTDWILTFQSKDTKAYSHSVARWRKTQSAAWLAVALTKATRISRGLAGLIADAEKVDENSPAYPTLAYHLVRLRLEMNRSNDAKKLLDTLIATKFDTLPVSSQNLLLEQRVKLSSTVDEFLRFAMRKPVTFYEYGSYGSVSDLLRIQKAMWEQEVYGESKEEHERKTEETFKQFLPWDERKVFDPDAADLFNWHFSLNALFEAAHSSELPEYQKKNFLVAVWTRSVLLKNDAVARQAAPELASQAPEMSSFLTDYLNAQTRTQRDREALFIMLKFSNLSPYVPYGVPEFSTAEESDYYFETSWWCKPEAIEYHMDGTESPKVVPAPRFIGAQVLGAAKKERAALIAIGDAKSWLGKRVLEWARRTPADPRMPEALYIAIQANQSYKYGCGSWEQDEDTRNELEELLKEKYPNSSWAVRLAKEERNTENPGGR